jgi:hypothetical protein
MGHEGRKHLRTGAVARGEPRWRCEIVPGDVVLRDRLQFAFDEPKSRTCAGVYFCRAEERLDTRISSLGDDRAIGKQLAFTMKLLQMRLVSLRVRGWAPAFAPGTPAPGLGWPCRRRFGRSAASAGAASNSADSQRRRRRASGDALVPCATIETSEQMTTVQKSVISFSTPSVPTATATAA